VKRLAFALLFILGVVLLGAGVPLAWVWIASRFERSLDGLSYLPLAVMVFGMLGTYVALTYAGTALDMRVRRRDRRPPPRRTAWTRSLSSERHTVSRSTPVETMFITATVVVAIAFEVWLFVFAGSSVPTGTG
jgi:hypothetical protein